jgi:regulator of replication initiation timing
MNRDEEIDIENLKYEVEKLKEENQELQVELDTIKKQLILSGVSKCLNEQTLENINNIMWESHMIKSKTFDKTQGTMIMQELEKWAGR